MKLKIDNRELELSGEMTLFHAARRLGIEIPVMCYKEGYDHFTSCMLCVVKDKTSGRTLPACSAMAADGMEIETQSEEIRQKRRSTLELLLSDHTGDCEAPCQRVCPIHMEIPRMIRHVMENQLAGAIAAVRRDIAVPSILERYCNAPCEKGCRRSKVDEGLSIRHLTRFVADQDLQRETPYVPPALPSTGKTVAIIGAGMTGLSAAHFLALKGHACTVFERGGRIGGRVETEFDGGGLPDWVVEGELKVLRGLGIRFEFNTEVGRLWAVPEVRERFDAVVVACGRTGAEELISMGLPVRAAGVSVTPSTLMTPVDGVFAGGSVLKPKQPLVKSAIAAKWIAACVDQYLNGAPMVGLVEMYNHTMGRLLEGEIETFAAGASQIPRLNPENVEADGFCLTDAELECSRCMHCDCRKKDECKLRIYSDQYGAKQSHFAGEQRAPHAHIDQGAGALYEPGKCVKCGLCVRITHQDGEKYGFAFVGRGFELKPGVSLDKTLSEGMALSEMAQKVCDSCPTGALAVSDCGPGPGQGTHDRTGEGEGKTE